MQQATSPTSNPTATTGYKLPFAVAPAPRFVINLCASTTPVALVQPSHAGLKRFTFFVSRRLEEGRERFRLHMGYFDTQEEAEKILDLVRDVYPAAWAGAAPGIKLRARAAASATAAAPAVTPAPAPAHAPVPAIAPSAAAAPASVPAASAPTHAGATTVKLELVPDRPRTLPVDAEPSRAHEVDGAARSLSDLRATIDSLGDAAAGPAPAASPPALEGAAVLRLLESPRPPPAARVAPTAPVIPTTVPVVHPATPQDRPLAARAAVPVRQPPIAPAPVHSQAPPRQEPALFAVQLLWSVQPIDMGQVPQLAIFSAYTLYGAEGNRDGRRWYGLRLGFFTDAVSAKQVAQYVRSEFTSVSVVPVTARERTRAGAATAKPLPPVAAAKRSGPELNFIEDVQTDTATSGSRPALKLPGQPLTADSPAVRAAIAAVGLTTAPSQGKRTKLRAAPGARPVAKRPAHNRPLSLEETLEILGAGELEVEKGRGELMNDAARRERKAPTRAGSRFGRLINRLAERLGNS